MRRAVVNLIPILALLGASANLLAQDVQYNYDRDANFAEYRSYQWARSRSTAADQLADQDIRRAIEAQLSQKGLQKTESGGDLYIEYLTAIDHERRLDGWTMGPRWSGMMHATTSRVDVGTIVLSFYDPARRQLVWRGSVSKTLNVGKDPDKNYKNLEKAIASCSINTRRSPANRGIKEHSCAFSVSN